MSEPRSVVPVSPARVIAEVIDDMRYLVDVAGIQIAEHVLAALEENDVDLVWHTTGETDDTAE